MLIRSDNFLSRTIFYNCIALLFSASGNASELNVTAGTIVSINAGDTLIADGISSNAGHIFNERLLNTTTVFSNTAYIYNNLLLNSGSVTLINPQLWLVPTL